MGGGAAFGLIATAYRPTVPLTLPSPHKGERATAAPFADQLSFGIA